MKSPSASRRALPGGRPGPGGAADAWRRYSETERLLITVTVICGSISTILSATIINVGIPEVMGTYGIGYDQAQWLSTAFLAAMTSAMVMSDFLLKTFGQRGIYMLALTVFSIGSALGGLAPDFEFLIMARALQGMGAGAAQPIAMLALYQIYPPNQRGKAMGIFGIGVMLGPAIGPYVGGIAIDAFSWRAAFFMPVPFCIFAAMLAMFTLAPRDRAQARPKFDWVGFACLMTFITTLLIGLSNGTREGWHSEEVVTLLAVAALAFVSFIFWESGFAYPILDMRLFRHPRFVAAMFVSFVLGAGIFANFYLVPLFVQIIQGYTPTDSGLLQMPGSFVLLIFFPIVGYLTDRGETNRLIAFGFFLMAISNYLLIEADTNTPFWLFVGWVVVGRVGMGFVFGPMTTASLRLLPPELLGQGSGAMNFIRQLGGAFGVNLIAFSVENRLTFHWQALKDTQTSGNFATTELFMRLQDVMRDAGVLVPSNALYDPSSLYFLGRVVYAQASVSAFRDGFLEVAIWFTIAVPIGLFIHGTHHRQTLGAGRPLPAGAD